MNEPALDLDVGHAAPNEWVLTSHEEQHLLTYCDDGANREGVAWIEWLLAGPAAPVHLRRQQRRGDPGKRLQGGRSPGDDPRRPKQ